jgi:hypothetical protein
MKTINSFHLPVTTGPVGAVANMARAVAPFAVKALFSMPADSLLRQVMQPGNAASQFPALAPDQQITAQNAAARVSVPGADAAPANTLDVRGGIAAVAPMLLAATQMMAAARAK